MSDMKCPVCGKDMVFIESDEGFDVFVCTSSKCQCSGYANESVWKYIERTRKALDDARHTIGWINQMIDEHTDKQAIKIKCEYALEQITALEQKE